MTISTDKIAYSATNSFSKIIIDFLNNEKDLSNFYFRKNTIPEIEAQITDKQKQNIDRALLVEVLETQYQNLDTTSIVKENISLLKNEKTFTICTAHQPNIFTGHLYFIYKILHIVAICNELKKTLPNFNFVPIYYMGSEDADLAELGEINVDQSTWHWQTKQTGAVGRMYVDDALLQLIQQLENRYYQAPHANEIFGILKQCYTLGNTIQQATLQLVNTLLGKYGVVVLIADNAKLKATMKAVFTNEIENQKSHQAVSETASRFPSQYKQQAFSRPINLFYLKNKIRERIEQKEANTFIVNNTDLTFTKNELITLINSQPELISPNVILRGLYQETILPNIMFIGGGGEIAYWLQLKNVFDMYATPYPILQLRNSFTLGTEKQKEKWQQIGFVINDLFENINDLEKKHVLANSNNSINTDEEKTAINEIYTTILDKTNQIDATLKNHVLALQTKQINKLKALDKKMLKKQKQHFSTALQQIQKIKNDLFPNQQLQERFDNIVPYYANYGAAIFDQILVHSNTVENNFTLLWLIENK